MIRQSVLPFKLEITGDTITSHAGLALFGEFLKASGLEVLADRHLPNPGSSAGYNPCEYIFPLVLMLNGGGRSLEDMRVIRGDSGLGDILEMEAVPSSDAIGDWLRRMGTGGGLSALNPVNRKFLERGLRDYRNNDYTLDMDATAIEAKKESAEWTYKGFKGYMPIVGHLAENGLVVCDEFREGNEAPASRNLEFLKECIRQMPKGRRIKYLRSDSAAYQADVFNHCEEDEIEFAIGADMDIAVRGAIKAIPEEGWRPFKNGYISETVHSMNRTKKAFRLIVIKRPLQGELFGPLDESGKYTVIASNRNESAEETVAWYNRRGDTSENRIKDLKLGFGMERMPCGQFEANAMFFRIGVIAHNLFVLFKRNALPGEWESFQVQTIRWRLFSTAGKVVRHSGKLSLKVGASIYEMFKDIRRSTWEFTFG